MTIGESSRPRRRLTLPNLRGSLAWAGYAAFAWALAYAVGVRGYQGLGGTVGLPGTFEDPDGFRSASPSDPLHTLSVKFRLELTVKLLALPEWMRMECSIASSLRWPVVGVTMTKLRQAS